LLTVDPKSGSSAIGAVLSLKGKKPSQWSDALREGQHLDNTIFQQVDVLKRLVGSRHVDAITISIGVNDVNWTGVVLLCSVPEAVVDCVRVLKNREAELVDALPKLYEKLGEYISSVFPKSQLDPSDVYLVGYPDPLRQSPSKLCDTYIADFKGSKI